MEYAGIYPTRTEDKILQNPLLYLHFSALSAKISELTGRQRGFERNGGKAQK